MDFDLWHQIFRNWYFAFMWNQFSLPKYSPRVTYTNALPCLAITFELPYKNYLVFPESHMHNHLPSSLHICLEDARAHVNAQSSGTRGEAERAKLGYLRWVLRWGKLILNQWEISISYTQNLSPRVTDARIHQIGCGAWGFNGHTTQLIKENCFPIMKGWFKAG